VLGLNFVLSSKYSDDFKSSKIATKWLRSNNGIGGASTNYSSEAARRSTKTLFFNVTQIE